MFQDLALPSYLLDLMCLCWAHDPLDRPSAAEIRRLASTPEFANLYQMTALPACGVDITVAAAAPHMAQEAEDDGVLLWLLPVICLSKGESYVGSLEELFLLCLWDMTDSRMVIYGVI